MGAHGRRRRRNLAAILSTTLSVTLIPLAFGTVIAQADSGGIIESATTGTSPGGTQADAITAAAKARSTGAPVPVDSATTQTSSLTANPDGSFTQSQSLQPVRVKKNDGWKAVDATLQRNTDGNITTSATPTILTLSSGGSGPLARMTTADGKELALSWPDPLPAPTVLGNSALYPGVLPDVDLRIAAQDQGGFTEVLIVKTPDAARNPKLATLRISASTTGLTLADGASGTLAAKDASGATVFSAPTPTMWDSSTAASAPAALRSAPAQTSASGDGTGSSATGPGAGAKQAGLQATVSQNAITLTPDQKLLTAADTRFPVYIDPNWVPRNTGVQTWGAVWEGHDGQPWDTQWGDPGVGYQGYETVTGIERVYYKFDTSFYSGKTVHSATLNMLETYSASWSCDKYTVNVFRTDSFDAGVSWNSAPARHEQIGSTAVPGTRNNACPGNQPAIADITSAVASAGSTLSVGVFAADESDRDAFKRFSTNPTLTVQYNTVPSVPTSPITVPAPQSPSTPDCGQNTPFGWISATNIAGDGIHLRAKVSDPDTSQLVRGQFALWDYNTQAVLINMGDANSSTDWIGNGSTADKAVGRLTDGHTYSWFVRTDDGINHSATTPACHFQVDTTAPSQPTVTSTDFPASGSMPGTSHVAGDGFQGQFTVTATDAGSGVDHFEYSLNSANPVGGNSTIAATNGSATIKLAPTRWGTNFLYVSAVDKAGNRSQSYEYAFYVPDNTQATTAPGDLTGDGKPDTAIVDKNGNIRIYTVGSTDPALAVPVAANQAPDHSSWNGAILAHRGTMHGSAKVDDLFVYKSGNLYIYLNPGNGDLTRTQATAVPRPTCDSTVTDCSGYAADWSHVSQLVTPGNADGNAQGHNDLITVENDELWLFPGNGSGRLLSPVLISPSGWNSMTVLAPGDVTGDGLPDLWARDRTSGNIYVYPNRTGDPKGLGDGTTRSLIRSGVSVLSYPALTSDGDVDGDGHPDMIAANWDGRLTEFPGQAATGGQNSLGTPVDLSRRDWSNNLQSIEGVPYLPSSRSDFNSDGRADMVAQWPDGTLHLYTGDAGGQLVAGPQMWDKSWGGMKLMATGDFNSDGKADLVGLWPDGTLHFYPGTGGGGLDGANVKQLFGGSTWASTKQIVAGDFDGDGKTDLVAIWGDGTLHLYSNNGNGDLNSSTPLWSDNTWSGMKLLAAGDFTGDGNADILAEWTDGTLHLYIGDGHGKLGAGPQMIGGNTWSGVTHLTPGDFSGDGKTDVAAVWADGSLHLYAGDGNGHLTDSTPMWPDNTWGNMPLIS
ncbi:FG-GAP-like repeat-containing protein [Streptomyces sp. NPDC051994]|uniref:FG-GAP-like repeat-containing protein n=1 Tax=unclassified Streptomyces TaxID=2593676 RepID=UPI00341D94CD